MSQFMQAFEAFERECGRDPVHATRKRAMARFAQLGLPDTKLEAWRYTNVGPFARQRFELARHDGNAVSASDVERLGLGAGLVFVDGHFRPDLSTLPVGIRALGLDDDLVRSHLGRQASFEDDAFVALNTAFLQGGAFLHIEEPVEEPVHLLLIGTGKASYPRILIVVGERARAAVVETYASVGDLPHLTNSVTEIVVGVRARLDHYRLQFEGPRTYHFAHMQARQERDSRFTSHVITLGGALTRNDITTALDAEGARATLNGLFLTRGTQHVDNHTRIEHRKPNGESHELYKGILDDRSTGVFSGTIHVFEDAQKTDAYQSSANLLLSDKAVVDSQPQLEIYADDVRCSHGSTTGQMDEDALFYLRSRGLRPEVARNMLIRAFAKDVTDRIGVSEVRERLEQCIAERLPA